VASAAGLVGFAIGTETSASIIGPSGRCGAVESITVGWCSYEQALAYIERTLRGEDDGNDFAVPAAPRIPDAH
jgi:hypothetical protein